MTDQSRPLSEYALVDLLDAFASNTPVPGGGSAVALAGALGVSLLIMAAGLPKSRTGAPEEAADLAEAAARLRPLRDTLVTLIDEDASAYRAVMDAMKLPKESEQERARRTDALQSALKGATDVPLDVLRACQQALAGAVIVAQNGYRAAASDIAVGIELLSAAVRGLIVNIEGNLKGITDPVYTGRTAAELKQLEIDSGVAAGHALRQVSPLDSAERHLSESRRSRP